MPKLFLLFSHTPTQAQRDDAHASLNVSEVVPLPLALKTLWANVPPENENLHAYVLPFYEHLQTHAKEGDYVLISGDFGATFLCVQFALSQKLIPIYATTKRVVSEQNGIKTSVFEHVRFRAFEPLIKGI